MMEIKIYTSSQDHPVYSALSLWKDNAVLAGHNVALLTGKVEDIGAGDMLFLISCSSIVNQAQRQKFRHVLVVHASDLPQGRGWSPAIWQILEGKNDIKITMLEAEDQVDTGKIWAQKTLKLEGHELSEEINSSINDITCNLMTYAIEHATSIIPRPQSEEGATYYRRRTPEDSRIDPEKTIAEQFDLLRVCDPARYPAFFEYRGKRYNIILSKA